MNRVKVWAYAVVVAAAAILTIRAHTSRLRAAATAELDARLAAASAQALASARAVAREASAAAAVASREPALVAALHAKEGAAGPLPRKGSRERAAAGADAEAQETALREAARAALDAAERALGFELPDGTVITAGNREWLARKGEASEAEGDPMAYLRGAIEGKARSGYVRLNGVLFHAAATPAGDGAGLVVLAPVDEAWAKGVTAATGAQATLSVPEVNPVSTAGPEAAALSAGARVADAGFDVGQAAKPVVGLGPVKLPGLPVPCGAAAAHRARAVPLEGVKDGFVILSSSTAPALAAISQFHWVAILVVAALLVVGAIVGFLVPNAVALPEGLLEAAARIERGDFAARAPALAGKLGTLATALNRAAELAGPAAARVSARASITDEFFAGGSKARAGASQPEAGAPAAASEGAPATAEPTEPAAPEAAAAPEAPAAREPAAAPEPPAPAAAAAPSPTSVPAPAPAAAVPSELLQSAARTAPPAAEGDEDAQWRQIFQEFLRTRASCGEPSEGLSYERFRLKLEGNKAALVAKYGCRTVRFMVYVKDGKAALKATPVK